MDKEIISFEDLVLLVKRMRHNQRRFENLRKPEINETRKKDEERVDYILNKLDKSQLKIWE